MSFWGFYKRQYRTKLHRHSKCSSGSICSKKPPKLQLVCIYNKLFLFKQNFITMYTETHQIATSFQKQSSKFLC